MERRKRKRQGCFSESLPPIHITKVIAAHYSQDSVGWSNGSLKTQDDGRIWPTTKLDIPPPIDQFLYRYCAAASLSCSSVKSRLGRSDPVPHLTHRKTLLCSFSACSFGDDVAPVAIGLPPKTAATGRACNLLWLCCLPALPRPWPMGQNSGLL